MCFERSQNNLRVTFTQWNFASFKTRKKQEKRGNCVLKHESQFSSQLSHTHDPPHLRTVFENHRKVSFDIASEASYIYILSGQKLINNAKIQKFKRDFLGDF